MGGRISADRDLFPQWEHIEGGRGDPFASAKAENRNIKHVIGGLIGLDLTQQIGRDFLAEW